MKIKYIFLFLFFHITIYSNFIKIASFNIQIFGKAKASKPEVINILSSIITNFDIIAIQEIRDASGETMPFFIKEINSISADKYNYIISERLGRTKSKEQYAFIYNSANIKFNNISYNFDDSSQDLFEREPYIAYFTSGQFDFFLVNIHIKPDKAVQEINALIQVITSVQMKLTNEKDIILLGDFNADGNYFNENIKTGLRSDKYLWVINDTMDTTVADNNYTYDRIIFLKKYTYQDFTGSIGVFRFDQVYNITINPKSVSDHYPVWSAFYTNKDND